MYSFLKKVVSTLTPWGSDVSVTGLEEEEQRIINSIKRMNTDSEEIGENNTQHVPCGQSDALEYDVEAFKCFHKSGKVTHLSRDYGLIDDVIYFEHNQVSAGLVLKPDDEVLYSVYKVKENEADRVYRVYALKNDSWECGKGFDSEPQPEHIEKIEEIRAMSRVVTGRVTQRKGREVYIESANVWCHLDKIQTTYIPIEGDWVELEAVVSICEDSADLAGDILEIKSLKPLLTKSGCGRVTFWCDVKKEGAIENSIYFTNIPCEEGYTPNLGDEVVYKAVESDQGDYDIFFNIQISLLLLEEYTFAE